MEWEHWSRAKAEWDRERWPNFSPQEMACKGTGRLKVDPASLDALQALRNRLGRPLIITSAYRSPEHNRRVGGAKRSQHLLGKAFDVRMDNVNPRSFERAAREVGFTSFGHYPRSGFMHIDTRQSPARWNVGGWFEASETATPPEPAPQRAKEAAQGGVISAGGVVAAGEVVAAGMREAAMQVPPDWSRYLLLGAVVIGVGVALWRILGRRSAEPNA